MTAYLVTRHPATRQWAQAMDAQGKLPFAIDSVLEHLDIGLLEQGDVVVGTLPVHIAAQLHHRKIAFWSLDLDVPPSERGKELTSAQLATFGARLTRYEVHEKETQDVAAARKARRAQAKPQPSITLIPVSDQLVPAAIGWLHERTEQVALLASPRMLDQAERLKEWFDGHADAPTTSILEWDDENYASLLAQAERWVAAFASESRPRVVVNLTGGTKPMAMALQRAFGKHRADFGEALRAPYVDTEHGVIAELLAEPAVSVPMRSVLNIRDMLALQGIEVVSAYSASEGYAQWLQRVELFDVLLKPQSGEWLATWYQLLGYADWLVDSRKNNSGKRKLDEETASVEWLGSKNEPEFKIAIRQSSMKNWPGLRSALQGRFGELLASSGVCSFDVDETSLTVRIPRKPLDELSFAMGGWLEAWCASRFAALDVDEWAQGITVKRGGVENEFDLIAICGNQTLVVEAKTATLTREGKVDSRGTEAVYKLDALADKLGRLFNRRWLITLRPLSDSDRERARRHGITVFHGEAARHDVQSLCDLPRAIESWLRHCRAERISTFAHSVFAPPR